MKKVLLMIALVFLLLFQPVTIAAADAGGWRDVDTESKIAIAAFCTAVFGLTYIFSKDE